MKRRNASIIEQLIQKGVKIPNPDGIEIGDGVDPDTLTRVGRVNHQAATHVDADVGDRAVEEHEVAAECVEHQGGGDAERDGRSPSRPLPALRASLRVP